MIYRFVAELEIASHKVSGTGPAVASDEPAESRILGRWGLLVATLAAIALAAGWFLWHEPAPASAGTVAVLPVTNQVDDEDLGWVRVGESPATVAADIAEVITGLLSSEKVVRPERFSKVSTDPFVNELHARALDLELAGELEEARDYYVRVEQAYRESGQEPGPFFHNNYAGLLAQLGDLDAAQSHAEAAFEGFRLRGQRRNEAPALNRLAKILLRQGDIEGALAHHEQALAIYLDLDNVVGELSVLLSLTNVYRAKGDFTRARINVDTVIERAGEAWTAEHEAMLAGLGQ